MNISEFSKDLIFDVGKKIENSPYFSGDVYESTLDQAEDDKIQNVTFAPGAINSWHSHTLGQTLLVTAGEGLVCLDGQKPQIIKPGDVINIPKNTRHWHGATKDSYMSHLSIGRGDFVWYEPVNREEYEQL